MSGRDWKELPGINWRNPGFKQEDNHPVVVVTWNDAQAFCKWATKLAGRTVRLPSEAEWEYAARGPQSLKYPWGDKWEGIPANVADASLKAAAFSMHWGEIKEDDGFPFTSPVGHYKNSASWRGAFDMAGNVWQWCEDYFNDKYYAESPAIDPQGPAPVPAGRTGYAAAKPAGHGNGNGRRTTATEAQQRAIYAICESLNLDMAAGLADYNVTDAGPLSVKDASRLIDDLKGRQNGAAAQQPRR